MAELLNIIVWPTTIIIVVLIFKKPITLLITSITEVVYDHEKKRAKISFLSEGLKDVKEKLEITEDERPKQEHLEDPKAVILQAWIDLEDFAQNKLKELQIDPSKEDFRNSALRYLEYKGALSPKVEAAIQEMQMLRNQITHYPTSSIPQKEASDFIKAITKIKKGIDALETLPAMQLNAVTMIMRNLAHLADTGKYNNITISEVHRHIENETILEFISNLDGAQELKSIFKSDLWKGFANFYIKSLKSIYYGYAGDERKKWGIENSGICLLIAWTNEIIQMGSGWYPNENLSELDK